jgi:hypothetical protein
MYILSPPPGQVDGLCHTTGQRRSMYSITQGILAREGWRGLFAGLVINFLKVGQQTRRACRPLGKKCHLLCRDAVWLPHVSPAGCTFNCCGVHCL